MKIQEQLNRISDNYPLIPKVVPDGIFGEATQMPSVPSKRHLQA